MPFSRDTFSRKALGVPFVSFVVAAASGAAIISYDIISYDIISYDIISDDIISYDIISYDITSYDIISYDFISYDIILYNPSIYPGGLAKKCFLEALAKKKFSDFSKKSDRSENLEMRKVKGVDQAVKFSL